MKLLAHLIYLLNEQGVGNTFYLSPIIKKSWIITMNRKEKLNYQQ